MKRFAKNRVRVKAFHALVRFAGWLQKIPAKTTPPPFRLMQIGSAFWQSRALYVATRLGLADELGDGRKTVAEMAASLDLHEGHLCRLMRMLGSMGVFKEVAPRVFVNSTTSQFLRSDNEDNVRAMVLMHNSPEMARAWFESLEGCVRDGCVPFESANGSELFSYMDRNKEFDLLFSQAMDCVENLIGNAFLQDFDWGPFARIIDVGGSKGSKAITILQSNPHLRAVVFDRPQVIAAAAGHWAGRVPDEVLARVDFQAGDMFDGVPAAVSGEDLYLLFAIFHGLSDTECEAVLMNLREAAGDRRPYILFGDAVAEQTNIDPTIASFDMQMLVGTRGRERTLPEWRGLLEPNGFDIVDVVEVRALVRFIVARPR